MTEWTPEQTLEVYEAIKPVEWMQETGADLKMRLVHEDGNLPPYGWTIESKWAHPGYEAEDREDGWSYWHAPTFHEARAIVFYAAVDWLLARDWTVSLRRGDVYSAIAAAIRHTKETEGKHGSEGNQTAEGR